MQAYLRQRGIDVTDGELKRWHPDFPLHDVADVPVSPLPTAPKSGGIASAQVVLARLQHKEETEETTVMPPVVAMPTQQNEALKGVSANLIEKVCVIHPVHCCVLWLCVASTTTARVDQTAGGSADEAPSDAQ